MNSPHVDAYAIARYVRHYHAKNGYSPRRGMLGCSAETEDMLVRNGVIELRPIWENGPAICIVLTDKGRRMSERR